MRALRRGVDNPLALRAPGQTRWRGLTPPGMVGIKLGKGQTVRIKSQRDFWSGLMFMAAGVAFAWAASGYAVGSAARMGPGYFPLMLGVLLAVLGAVITLQAMTIETEDGEPVAAWDWRSIVLVLGAVSLFGALLVPAGLIVALVVLVVVSSFASHEFGWRATLINAVVLVALCLVTFVWGLKLQFPLLPRFLQ